MWTATEPDNLAAQATYLRAGARVIPSQVVVEWDFGGAARQHGE
jgi:hypothetical protein